MESMGIILIIMLLFLLYGAIGYILEFLYLIWFPLFQVVLFCEATGMALHAWERTAKSRTVVAAFFLFSLGLPPIVDRIAGVMWADIDSAHIAAAIITQTILFLLFLADNFLSTVRAKHAALLLMCVLLTSGILLWSKHAYSCYTARAKQRAEATAVFFTDKPEVFVVSVHMHVSFQFFEDIHKGYDLSLPFSKTYPFANMPAGSRLAPTGSSIYIDELQYIEVYSPEHDMAGYISEKVLKPIAA